MVHHLLSQYYLPPDTRECDRLNPSRIGRYSICLPWRDGRLSWPRWPVINRDGLPVCRQSPIQAVIRPGVDELCWSKPNALTSTLGSYVSASQWRSQRGRLGVQTPPLRKVCWGFKPPPLRKVCWGFKPPPLRKVCWGFKTPPLRKVCWGFKLPPLRKVCIFYCIVRENVWSKAKKRKKSRFFWIFKKKRKKCKKRKSNNMYCRPKILGLNTTLNQSCCPILNY